LYAGRFKDWHDPKRGTKRKKVGKYPNPPWAIAKDGIPWVEAIIDHLKYPASWPLVRKFFTDLGHMKTSETLLFAGDIGAYFLRHMDIHERYKALFIRLIRVTGRSTSHNTLTYSAYHLPYANTTLHAGACTRQAPRETGNSSFTSCPCS
jgi:hypothetical protein